MIQKLPNDIYFRDSRMSSTSLIQFKRSPAHYQSYRMHGIPVTAAMAEGTIAHGWILEHSFDENLLDEKIKSTIVKDGKVRIGHNAWEHIQKMKESVYAHPAASKLLTNGQAEMAVFGTIADVECKAKPDYLRQKDLVCVELKTTQNASPEAWSRNVANWSYHIQAAFYLMVLFAHSEDLNWNDWNYVWIAVEKTPPYAVGVYMPSDRMMAQAMMEVEALLESYKICISDNYWPAYSSGIVEIDLPRWAQKEVDYE